MKERESGGILHQGIIASMWPMSPSLRTIPNRLKGKAQTPGTGVRWTSPETERAKRRRKKDKSRHKDKSAGKASKPSRAPPNPVKELVEKVTRQHYKRRDRQRTPRAMEPVKQIDPKSYIGLAFKRLRKDERKSKRNKESHRRSTPSSSESEESSTDSSSDSSASDDVGPDRSGDSPSGNSSSSNSDDSSSTTSDSSSSSSSSNGLRR